MSRCEASGITLSDCARSRNHGLTVSTRTVLYHAPLRLRRMQEEENRRRSRIYDMIRQYPSPFRQSQLSRTPASYRTEPPSYYSLIAANVPALLRKERENKSVQTVSYWEIDLSPGSLSEDFSELLDKGSHHDVVFYCEVQLIRAHKIVLSARSEVLRAMLHSDMREGLIGVVDIRDMNLSDLKDFVRYLYTDKLPERLTREKATVLYEAGDRYDVKSLMRRCSEYLVDRARPKSFPQLLALASAHSDQQFKNRIMDKQIKKKSRRQPSMDVSRGSLSKDFSELLDKGFHHDVEFHCEGQLIKAHKVVLYARSEVFRAMLHSDMREGLTGVVDIRDMNLSDLKDFVRYLYTDRLPDRLTSDMATVLYEAGDRYGVKSLMHRCSEYLLDSACLESFPRLLALAAAHSDQKLMIGLVHQQMKNGGLHLFDMSTIQILYSHFPYLTADNKTVLRSLFSEPVPKRVQTELNWNVDQSGGSLSRDLSNLLSSGANYDVTLNCGGQSIPAHKIVLGARSERLKAMLLQQQDDSATAQRGGGALEIGDIDSGDFQDFVRYLYTDELPVLNFAKAKSLYEAGEKYGVRNLMRRCSNLKIS